MLTAIVLAAGSSKRMGAENKLLLSHKSKTIIETTILQILDAPINEVIVVTGFEADKITMTIQYLPVKIIYNINSKKGMTTSIQKGIESAKGNGYMICLADMLAITAAEYNQLQTFFEECLRKDEQCICIPRFNNEKGNPVIFSSSYKEEILKHADMEGCKTIVQTNKQHIHWLDMETDHILQDLDYPKDYKAL
jgi:molybdenum cofactor cytidylyltransferase